MTTNFTWIDGAIIVVYLLTLTGIGVYFTKRQKGLKDFLLADRSMAWLPVGLSLMAALNSGIDYLMVPANAIKYGLLFVAGTASWLVLYPWMAKVSLPFYQRLRVYSAYEYLERRFDVRVRLLGAGIFLLWRLGWMATALYVPCLAANVVTGGRLQIVPMVIVVGSVVTLYTLLGGIKAVLWTDVIQFCIMFAGLAAAVIIVLMQVPGGLGEVWNVASTTGRTDIFPPISGMPEAGLLEKLWLFLKEPVTAAGLLIGAIVSRMTTYTSDQVMVQRFQTTRSLKDAKRAFVINAAGDAVWMIGLVFVGLVLHAYFQHHPHAVGLSEDKIFPTFVAQIFPTGAVGLVIAAIFAASLSSVDSAINSCSSVVVVDFYNRLKLGKRTGGDEASDEEQRAQIRVSRLATLVVGVIGMILATNVSRLGNLLEITNKAINSFTGPLFGIFLLGMFSKRSQALGVLIGGMIGTLVSAYVAFSNVISSLWPSTFGLVTTLVCGWGLSRVMGAPAVSSDQTFAQIMLKPEIEDRNTE